MAPQTDSFLLSLFGPRQGEGAVMEKLHRWLVEKHWRVDLLCVVALVNRGTDGQPGKLPSQWDVISRYRDWFYEKPHLSTLVKTLTKLVHLTLLADHVQTKPRYSHRFQVDWVSVGILSDWQEGQGHPRLDEKLRAYDAIPF